MGIENLHLAHLVNNAHFQLQTQFGNLIVATGAAALKIEPLYTTWHTSFRLEDDVIKKITKSPLTGSMDAADRRRDVAYRGIAETNRAALNHFWEVVRTAAGHLTIVFNTYGNVVRMPLNEETAAITNLLQELKGTYAGDVETVGLQNWVKELETANNAFEQLAEQRHGETAGKTDLVLRHVRADVDAAYRAITRRIEAL
ncbi:MAG: DUF6261 family protein, partial [Bacteroidales bacterium]|nr:DUF6261 family protein [Bacteroidales bacterium]